MLCLDGGGSYTCDRESENSARTHRPTVDCVALMWSFSVMDGEPMGRLEEEAIRPLSAVFATSCETTSK